MVSNGESDWWENVYKLTADTKGIASTQSLSVLTALIIKRPNCLLTCSANYTGEFTAVHAQAIIMLLLRYRQFTLAPALNDTLFPGNRTFGINTQTFTA
jgi:hypothetical protein